MSQKIKLTKSQFKRSMITAIKLNESNKIVKQTVSATLIQEAKNKKYIEKVLKEGPLGNVWKGMKDAGTAVMNKIPGIRQQNGQDLQLKTTIKHLSTLSGQVDKARSKFESELLKDTQIIGNYVDAVVALSRAVHQQTLGATSPEMAKIVATAQDKIRQLEADLESEKEAIESFIKSFNMDTQTTDAAQAQTETGGHRHAGRPRPVRKTGK